MEKNVKTWLKLDLLAFALVCVMTAQAHATVTIGTDNSAQKNSEAKQEFDKWKKDVDVICSSPEYKIITDRTPCYVNQITTELLADRTKITPEQKQVFLSFKKAIDESKRELRKLQRRYGGSNGSKTADMEESQLMPELDKNDMNLYEEKITWGEFLQQRRDLYNKFQDEVKRIPRQ
jgi:hypothetical protein